MMSDDMNNPMPETEMPTSEPAPAAPAEEPQQA